MTNELAIKIFKRLIKHGFIYDDGYGQEELTNDEEEACKLAIKALDVVDGLEDAIAEITEEKDKALLDDINFSEGLDRALVLIGKHTGVYK